MQLQIQILIASYAFLLLVFLLSRKSKLAHNKVFSWFIGIVLASLLFDILSESGVLNDQTNFNSFIGYLYGPLLLFYVQSISKVSLNRRLMFLHFSPALIVLSLDIIFYYFPSISGFSFWKVNIILMSIHLFAYTLAVFYQVSTFKNQKSLQHLHLWLSFLSWGFAVLLFIFCIEIYVALFNQFKFFTPIRISSLLVQLIYLNIMVYFGLATPEIFTKKQKYNYSNLSRSKKKELVSKLKKYMEEQEPFLDFDLTLQSLAEQTGIESAQLSQVINEHFNRNFKDFVNTYRIDRAAALLAGPENLITKEVMYHSGFLSKSTFNPVFKKHTGMTPSQFRREWKKANLK